MPQSHCNSGQILQLRREEETRKNWSSSQSQNWCPCSENPDNPCHLNFIRATWITPWDMTYRIQNLFESCPSFSMSPTRIQRGNSRLKLGLPKPIHLFVTLFSLLLYFSPFSSQDGLCFPRSVSFQSPFLFGPIAKNTLWDGLFHTGTVRDTDEKKE